MMSAFLCTCCMHFVLHVVSICGTGLCGYASRRVFEMHTKGMQNECTIVCVCMLYACLALAVCIYPPSDNILYAPGMPSHVVCILRTTQDRQATCVLHLCVCVSVFRNVLFVRV